MTSLRRRLTIVLLAGFAILLLAGGGWAAVLLHGRLTEEFDAVLLAKARALVSLTEQEGGRVELDYDADHMPEYERPDRPDVFQFWLAEGRALLRSRRLDADLDCSAVPPAVPLVRDVRLPDGRRARQVELAFVPKGPEEREDAEDGEGAAAAPRIRVVLAVARDREDLDRLLGAVAWVVGGVALLSILLAGLLVWRALATGLRPVDDLAREVQGLDAERLGARVRAPSVPRELSPVVDQLNALLARLEAAFERERRFAANVAHELRTPIAELRSLAAVGAAWPEDRDTVARFFEDVGHVAGSMERVIADLLLLARCQAGAERVAVAPVVLADAVDAAWVAACGEASARGMSWRRAVPADLVVQTDPVKLGMILSNLVGNAVSHGLQGTPIACTAQPCPGGWALEVANAAESLEADTLALLTEPFWRRDEARAAPDHAGLGLAVVRELATLLALRLTLRQGEDGTFRARIEPLAAAAEPAQGGALSQSSATRTRVVAGVEGVEG